MSVLLFLSFFSSYCLSFFILFFTIHPAGYFVGTIGCKAILDRVQFLFSSTQSILNYKIQARETHPIPFPLPTFPYVTFICCSKVTCVLLEICGCFTACIRVCVYVCVDVREGVGGVRARDLDLRHCQPACHLFSLTGTAHCSRCGHTAARFCTISPSYTFTFTILGYQLVPLV